MATATAQQLCDQARVRHAAFFNVTLPDGALLLFLNQRQRSLLLRLGRQVEALLNTSAQVAAVIDGLIVGIDANGNLVTSETITDGFAVSVDGFGNLYVDPAATPITTDPYGASGDTPGFPLPTSFVKAVAGSLVYDDGREGPVDIVPERARLESQGRNPTAFISGNRLVPVRPPASSGTQSLDAWARVTGVRLSYVALPDVSGLAQTLTLPDALLEALVAGLAELLAVSSRELSATEKQAFRQDRIDAEALLQQVGNEMLGDMSSDTVIYTG